MNMISWSVQCFKANYERVVAGKVSSFDNSLSHVNFKALNVKAFEVSLTLE